jgi:diaminopimelate epimerase
MLLKFSKYQGTGNDFILLDNLSGSFNDLTITQIKELCDRKLGIGADGLIKINHSYSKAFEMDYYNSDGSKSFCGNGARCAVAFAETLGIEVSELTFDAIDGSHWASKTANDIKIQMVNVENVHAFENEFELYTGSPHYVKISDDISSETILNFGKSIRFSPKYNSEGINVNLLKGISPTKIEIASYERGVENETLSCGTGATACALVWDKIHNSGTNFIEVKAKGGNLKIEFKRDASNGYYDIFLVGPAEFVYSGEINLIKE